MTLFSHRILPLVLAALLSTPAAFAQVVDAVRIAGLNVAYVARTSQASRAALAAIDDFGRKKALEVDSKAAELQKQQTELQKAAAMSPRAVADLQRAFDKSRVEFDRFRQDAQNEIEAMHVKFELEFRARLGPVIDEISKEKGLHFVFGLEQTTLVAWWSPSVDISDEVVKRLDAAK